MRSSDVEHIETRKASFQWAVEIESWSSTSARLIDSERDLEEMCEWTRLIENERCTMFIVAQIDDSRVSSLRLRCTDWCSEDVIDSIVISSIARVLTSHRIRDSLRCSRLSLVSRSSLSLFDLHARHDTHCLVNHDVLKSERKTLFNVISSLTTNVTLSFSSDRAISLSLLKSLWQSVSRRKWRINEIRRLHANDHNKTSRRFNRCSLILRAALSSLIHRNAKRSVSLDSRVRRKIDWINCATLSLASNNVLWKTHLSRARRRHYVARSRLTLRARSFSLNSQQAVCVLEADWMSSDATQQSRLEAADSFETSLIFDSSYDHLLRFTDVLNA